MSQEEETNVPSGCFYFLSAAQRKYEYKETETGGMMLILCLRQRDGHHEILQ